MREIIVGDLHGCARTYEALLARLRPDPGADRLVLLGDLFDRGPRSWEVLRLVKAQEQAFGDRFTLLRGNHEDYLLRPRLPLGTRLMWDRVGRRETVRSFRAHGERMEGSVPWLSAHCVPCFRGDGYRCAHAAVRTDPIEANDLQTLIHDRTAVTENRYAGPLTVTGHIALPAAAWFAGDGKTVTAVPEGERQPLPAAGILCIDTGCGKGGKLTAMVIEDGGFRLVSVPEEGSERGKPRLVL